jgi:antitoxin component YwqK of YwqJK toxin-antitoxin module
MNEASRLGTWRSSWAGASLRAMAWMGLAVLLAGAGAWWWKTRQGGAVEGPEVARDALILKDERLYMTNATAPFNGVVVERYPDGVVRSRSGVREGKLQGESRGWYPNGQLQVLEHFEAGISHGLRTKWHENGERQSEASIVQGVIEGVFRRWHPEGGLAEEIPMKAGQPDGLAKSFNPDGSPKAEAVLKSGQVVTQRFFNVEKPAPTLTTPGPGGAMPKSGP